MGSSLARVTYEISQVLLAGGQVVFLGDLPFSPHLRLTRLKMSEIILTGRKIKKIMHQSFVVPGPIGSRNSGAF